MDNLNLSIKEKTIEIDEEIKRIGKDEMNLIELPFTLLSTRNPKELKTIERKWIGKDENGQKKEFYKIITSSDKYGLPTFIGEEVYLACMELSYRQGFKDRTVHTTQYELLDLMKWPVNSGESYKRVIKAFNQLGGIFISTNAFWDNQNKTYKKVGFGILSNYEFLGNERRGRKSKFKDQLVLPFGYFRWDDIFFNEGIQKGNIKTLNTGIYFSLSSPTAKRLYRFVDKKLYNQETFEIDLFKLAFQKLEMIGETYKHPSKIIQNLQPAIQELKERGIINTQIKPNQTKNDYKVYFSLPTKTQVLIEQKLDIKTLPVITQAQELFNYFQTQLNPDKEIHRQPVKKELGQVQGLLNQYGEEKSKYIIDYAVKEGEKTKFNIKYFGAILGYVNEAVDDFEQEKAYQEKQQILKQEQEEKEKIRAEYEAYWEKQVEDFKTGLAPDELKELYLQTEKKLHEEYPMAMNWTEETIQQTIESSFKRWLIEQEKIKILSFEDWYKNESRY